MGGFCQESYFNGIASVAFVTPRSVPHTLGCRVLNVIAGNFLRRQQLGHEIAQHCPVGLLDPGRMPPLRRMRKRIMKVDHAIFGSC